MKRQSVAGKPAGGGPAGSVERLDVAGLTAAALSFLAQDPERLGRFLALSGLDPSSLREAARGSGFGAAVLGYLAQDEPLLLAFAEAQGLRPDRLALTIERLQHGSTWTDP